MGHTDSSALHKPRRQPWAILAVTMGVMLSPDSLVLLGNHMGTAGYAFLGSLALAGLMHLGTVYSTQVLYRQFPGPDGDVRGLQAALGAVPALVLTLCARVVFFVCASTGILAIAGYVINEVFVYWFPNLGFSFCLLGFLVVLNLLGHQTAARAQVLFMVLALSGLLILSMVSLTGPGPIAPTVVHGPGFALLSSVPAALLLFMGWDLVTLTHGERVEVSATLGQRMIMGLVLAGVVFCVWGLVSARTVPWTRLADSTVPHMITARALLSDTGRRVMGVTVLAGTCATVNALLMAGPALLVRLANHGLLPLALGQVRRRLWLTLLALGPAAMLAAGMAGEPETEVYTRAGVLFWLVYYAAIHVAILRLRWRHAVSQYARRPPSRLVPVLSLAAISLSVIVLWWEEHERISLLLFILILIACVSLLSLCWLRWRRRAAHAAPPEGSNC